MEVKDAAGSVVGDTTTTMMWIDGVSPLDVVEAYVAAGVALVVFGIPAALLQHKHMAISRDFQATHHIDWARVGIVGFILVAAIVTNVTVNLKFAAQAEFFPFLGAAIWVGGLLGLGWWLGGLAWVQRHFEKVVLAIVVVSVMPLAWEWWKAVAARRAARGGARPGG